MSDLQAYDDWVWDRLFDVLFACDESVTDDVVDAELQDAGIDMKPAFRRLNELIEQKTAREQLARAHEIRASMMEKLRDIIGPKVSDLRSGVRDFIDRAFSGPEQVAHYNKLETAATDEDLQSLLDDLTKLAELRRAKDDNGPETK